jgi:hypothetical protein
MLNEPTLSEAGFLNKSSCLAPALGVPRDCQRYDFGCTLMCHLSQTYVQLTHLSRKGKKVL